MIKIEKDFSYGILAIVALVAIVAIFNTSSTKVVETVEGEEPTSLVGETSRVTDKFVSNKKINQDKDVEKYINFYRDWKRNCRVNDDCRGNWVCFRGQCIPLPIQHDPNLPCIGDGCPCLEDSECSSGVCEGSADNDAHCCNLDWVEDSEVFDEFPNDGWYGGGNTEGCGNDYPASNLDFYCDELGLTGVDEEFETLECDFDQSPCPGGTCGDDECGVTEATCFSGSGLNGKDFFVSCPGGVCDGDSEAVCWYIWTLLDDCDGLGCDEDADVCLEEIPGCTDSSACNYDSSATVNDGSCDYTSCLGCTDSEATNYDPEATIDDGSCEYGECGNNEYPRTWERYTSDSNNQWYVDWTDSSDACCNSNSNCVTDTGHCVPPQVTDMHGSGSGDDLKVVCYSSGAWLDCDGDSNRCSQCGLPWVQLRDSPTGEYNTQGHGSISCCGDDEGEYVTTWERYTSNPSSPAFVDWTVSLPNYCCNSGSDCISANGSCVSYQGTDGYGAGDDLKVVCYSNSKWLDCDADSNKCSQCGFPWIYTRDGYIGEYMTQGHGSTSCCGDDAGEHFVTGSGTHDGSGCCSSSADCIDNTGYCKPHGYQYNQYECQAGEWIDVG